MAEIDITVLQAFLTQNFKAIDDRLETIESRLDTIEARMNALEDRMTVLEHAFVGLSFELRRSMDKLETRMK